MMIYKGNQNGDGTWRKARQGKASFCGLYSVVKRKLRINDACHCEEALADAAIHKENYLAKTGLLQLRLAMTTSYKSAFTLVELSIVLVIIGFITGGILLGKDLIHSAEIRSQVSQLQRFDSAVTTFKLKYGYLPRDISNADAIAFGLATKNWTGSCACQ